MWNYSYRTPTECWQKTSDFQKGKKIHTYLDRAKEKRKKRETKELRRDLHLWDGAVKEEKFPYTRKTPHWWGWWGELQSLRGERSNRGAESKAERFPHRGLVPTSTHQPKTLVCSPTRVDGGWELRLGLRRSDPRERTEIGCMNTA